MFVGTRNLCAKIQLFTQAKLSACQALPIKDSCHITGFLGDNLSTRSITNMWWTHSSMSLPFLHSERQRWSRAARQAEHHLACKKEPPAAACWLWAKQHLVITLCTVFAQNKGHRSLSLHQKQLCARHIFYHLEHDLNSKARNQTGVPECKPTDCLQRYLRRSRVPG